MGPFQGPGKLEARRVRRFLPTGCWGRKPRAGGEGCGCRCGLEPAGLQDVSEAVGGAVGAQLASPATAARDFEIKSTNGGKALVGCSDVREGDPAPHPDLLPTQRQAPEEGTLGR